MPGFISAGMDWSCERKPIRTELINDFDINYQYFLLAFALREQVDINVGSVGVQGILVKVAEEFQC